MANAVWGIVMAVRALPKPGRGGGAKAVGRGQGRGEWPMPYGA